MATFYGGVEGARGPATRQGSKASGLRVYAQSYDSRITVDYDDRNGKTCATVAIGGGWTTYYNTHRLQFNPDLVAAALDTGDERVRDLWGRIYELFDKLDEEAPKALQRARGEWQIKGHVRRLPDGREIPVKPHVRKVA
jgi:hypothetical protein